MFRLGPICILTEHERLEIIGKLAQAEIAMGRIESQQADVRGQQKAVIERQSQLLHEARRERDLAHARALEYQGLFVEQQAEIDSLQRQLSVALHPSTQPSDGES